MRVEQASIIIAVSYWTVVFVMSSLFLVGGLYFSFRLSLEARIAGSNSQSLSGKFVVLPEKE